MSSLTCVSCKLPCLSSGEYVICKGYCSGLLHNECCAKNEEGVTVQLCSKCQDSVPKRLSSEWVFQIISGLSRSVASLRLELSEVRKENTSLRETILERLPPPDYWTRTTALLAHPPLLDDQATSCGTVLDDALQRRSGSNGDALSSSSSHPSHSSSRPSSSSSHPPQQQQRAAANNATSIGSKKAPRTTRKTPPLSAAVVVGSSSSSSPSSSSPTATSNVNTKFERFSKSRPLTKGSAQSKEGSQRLGAVPPVQSRRLFVSKVRKGFAASDMYHHVKTLGANPIRVDRLTTRVDHYTSFCITVSAEDFKTIDSSSVWEEDVVFRQFNGVPATAVESFVPDSSTSD